MKRALANPVLTRHDIPTINPDIVDVTSVFNPGAVEFEGEYLLLVRVQTRGRETFLMAARGEDGVKFEVKPEIVRIQGLEKVKEKIFHVYDPRITKINDIYYIVFAADITDKCCLGIAKTRDFESFELVNLNTDVDSRNGVLFPEKINGRSLMLQRPNRVKLISGVTTGSDIMRMN